MINILYCSKTKQLNRLNNQLNINPESVLCGGNQHGDPWLCADWESWECLLSVSQLFLPPTTSSRLLPASGVTAVSLTAESQHRGSPGTCSKHNIYGNWLILCKDNRFSPRARWHLSQCTSIHCSLMTGQSMLHVDTNYSQMTLICFQSIPEVSFSFLSFLF